MINMPDERTNAEEPVSTGRELLGELLVVTGEDEATWPEQLVIQEHLRDIERLSGELMIRVVGAGLRGVYVGRGRVADLDDLQYLASFPQFDDVPAIYHRETKIIAAGTSGLLAYAQHNMIHEFGHAIADVLHLHDADQVIHLSVDPLVFRRLPPHARNGGIGSDRVRRELFAEAIRMLILDRDAAVDLLGSAFVVWLESVLGLA